MAGQATPTRAESRACWCAGQPVVTMAAPYVVAGCPFRQPARTGPCVTGAMGGRGDCASSSNGQPVVLMDSQAICAPTGTPLLPVVAQTRVIGS